VLDRPRRSRRRRVDAQGEPDVAVEGWIRCRVHELAGWGTAESRRERREERSHELLRDGRRRVDRSLVRRGRRIRRTEASLQSYSMDGLDQVPNGVRRRRVRRRLHRLHPHSLRHVTIRLPLWHCLPLPQDDVQEKGRGHEGRARREAGQSARRALFAAADHDHHNSTGRGAWCAPPGYDAIGPTHRHRRPARRWTRDPAPGAGAGASTGAATGAATGASTGAATGAATGASTGAATGAATGGSVRHGQQARLRWRRGRRRGRSPGFWRRSPRPRRRHSICV
jgi:hypothetical protein